MKKRPFQNYYHLYDVCRCRGVRCKKKYDCLRYMAKIDGYYSQTDFNPENCEHFYPMKVWTTSLGEDKMLSEITNEHLMAIIVHLYERRQKRCAQKGILDGLIEEFTKEAVRRELMESIRWK